MIPALVSKGMQAMHHDRSINQTFFEESKCNNLVVQKSVGKECVCVCVRVCV